MRTASRARGGAGMVTLAAALGATLLLCAAPAAAYPSYWVTKHAGDACGLPSQATLNAGHPVDAGSTNTNIKFTLKDGAGNTVTNVCAGNSYKVGLSFSGSSAHWFAISSVANSLLSGDGGCNNRRMYAATAVSSADVPLTVPAGTTGTVVLQVAASTGQGNTIWRNSLTMNVDTTNCGSSSPPPSSPPGPTPPPPSPNTPTPAPAPEPTKNTIKCPSAGVCLVCANTTACAACPEGYSLNNSTGTCDCATGYAAKRATGRKNTYIRCVKCSKNSISPGGGLSTAACTKCATGLSPNVGASACVAPGVWPLASYDLTNRRWPAGEKDLSPASVGTMQTLWSYVPDGDTSATPMVINGRLYMPTWSGAVLCLDAKTGSLVWSQTVVDLLKSAGVSIAPTDAAFVVSRSSMGYASSVQGKPAVFLGTMRSSIGGYPYMLALEADTGKLIWSTKMDDNPAATVTMSPTVYEEGKAVFVGVSSLEEARAASLNYTCCSFKGSFVKLDLETGAIKWRFYTLPTTDAWTGNSAWGSMPPIDKARNAIYFSTGDNYRRPQAVENCLKALGELTTANIPEQLACESLNGGEANYRNSIISLDIETGKVKWASKLGGADAWNAACFQKAHPNCPDVEGPDYDFAHAPMMVYACKKLSWTKKRTCLQLLVVGQKSGLVWALYPDSGKVLWEVPVGPGGVIGGHMWGSASDNDRVYVSNNNFFNKVLDPTELKGVPNTPGATSAPTTANGGMVSALDPYSGEINWSFFNPTKKSSDATKNAASQAPVTVANGVVLYASMDGKGTLFFLSATSGKLLGSFETGASNACGASVAGGVVYTGSGYVNYGLGTQGRAITALKFTYVKPPKGGSDGGNDGNDGRDRGRKKDD